MTSDFAFTDWMEWLTQYVAAQHRALDSVPLDGVKQLIEIVHDAWANGRTIFVAGNGGSAANASHFATDLGKGSSDSMGKRFRVLSLADNVSWLTAIGNDFSYDDVFVRPLQNYANSGDLFLAVSVSGNSPNLVKAAEWANSNGLTTAALVGGKRCRLGEIAKHVIAVGDVHYGRVEDVQMNILHMVCYVLMEQRESFTSNRA